MNLGISTYSFPWSFGIGGVAPVNPFTYADLIKIAADRGLCYVEFGDNYPLHLLPAADLACLKSMADEFQLNLHVGTRRLTLENLHIYFAISNQLHAPLLRVVIDDEDFNPTESNVIETITHLLPACKENNVRLIIENHDRFKSSTLKRIIEGTDPEWVGICLDTVNSLGAGESLIEVVDQLSRYTLNLHIKDFRIGRVKHKMGFQVQGTVAGEGMLDVPWLLKEIEKHGRCKSAILELWLEPEQTIEETIEKEKHWADKSITYLKTLLT
jgi:3-oxoisoapionate decarboxylase